MLGGALAATAASIGLVSTARAQATPEATPIVSAGDGRYLFVADRSQTTISLYSIPDFSLAGTIENVGFGTHAGAFLLPDGKLLFADTLNSAIVCLSSPDAGVPVVDATIPAELGGGVAWAAASPTLSHIVFGSLQDSEESQFLNIVDLATLTNTVLEFELNEPEELTAWLLNDPLNLYVAVGGQIKSYLLSEILAGNTELLSVVEVELGSHGGATDVANSRLFYTTAPGTGFEVLDARHGAAEYLTQIPWDVDGLSGGRNARPRVTSDGQHIFGLMTPGLEDPSIWAETVISNHVVDMNELTAQRVEIGKGNFGYRWGMSDRYAVWAGYDGSEGTVYLIDADGSSDTLGTVIASMPIALPANAAIAGEDFAGKDTYATAITADSTYAFVSVNGDKVVKVFDLARTTEIAEITLDIPLAGYDGYLTVIESGVTPADIWAR
jgi:hypothetical protein